jgi:hypothetical protein
MSNNVDLSRVTALSHKGCDLVLKGHNARAAEKFSRAADEAEKTLLFPDSLVTCSLRVHQLDALLGHATSSAAKPADANDVLREACLHLLPSVMAVLERRKAAGTLLPGSCRPVEETFQVAVKRHNLEFQGWTRASAAREAAQLAPYMGVGTYIRVSTSVAFMLINMIRLQHAYVLSDEQIDSALLFLASALDLMARPRDYDTWLAGEPELVRLLRGLLPIVECMDYPAVETLHAAWQRLLRSGVLRARGIDDGIDEVHKLHLRTRAAADADLAAGRLQQCALAGCEARESHASHFKKCGACRAVCYCCREHQVEAWPSHKAACKAAREAAADPADASGA